MVAGNPNITKETSIDLMYEPNSMCLSKLARNEACDPSVFEKLSKDLDPYVRARVAANRNAPQLVVENLIKDPSSNVRDAAAMNVEAISRSTSPNFLSEVYKKTSLTVDGLCCLANNTNTPVNILSELANHPSPTIRSAAVNNKGTA